MMIEKIKERLARVKYPNFEKDIMSYGFVKEIRVDDEKAYIKLEIVAANPNIADTLRKDIDEVLKDLNLKDIS